jgi:glycosyltransferase involved in cell wall biosynthesis
VRFSGWVDEQTLQESLAQADICLGAFGSTPQSYLSVQNKIYEGLAIAKPVLTADSPAVREYFEHGEHLFLCRRHNPSALAAAIVYLQFNTRLRQYLAEQGHRLFRQRYTTESLGERFKLELEKIAA